MALVDEIHQITKNFSDVTHSLTLAVNAGREAIENNTQVYLDVLKSYEQYLVPTEDNELAKKRMAAGLTPETAQKEVRGLIEYGRFFTLQSEIILSMSFIYLVAVFDAYVTDIFAAVLKQKPEILKGVEKELPYKKIIELHLSGELIPYLAEMEMNERGYASIKELAKYIQNKFQIDLADSGVSIDELSEIRAIRNILVHNNGVVNSIFLDIVKNSPYKPGEKVQITPKSWELSANKLHKVVGHVHDKIILKFCPIGS